MFVKLLLKKHKQRFLHLWKVMMRHHFTSVHPSIFRTRLATEKGQVTKCSWSHHFIQGTFCIHVINDMTWCIIYILAYESKIKGNFFTGLLHHCGNIDTRLPINRTLQLQGFLTGHTAYTGSVFPYLIIYISERFSIYLMQCWCR